MIVLSTSYGSVNIDKLPAQECWYAYSYFGSSASFSRSGEHLGAAGNIRYMYGSLIVKNITKKIRDEIETIVSDSRFYKGFSLSDQGSGISLSDCKPYKWNGSLENLFQGKGIGSKYDLILPYFVIRSAELKGFGTRR